MTVIPAVHPEVVRRAMERRHPDRRRRSGQAVPRAPIRLAPTPDLLAAARGSRLYTVVRAVLAWVRPGQDVEDGYPVDFAGFREALGAHPGQADDNAQEFWDVLVKTGMVHVDAARSLAWPGPAAVPSADDQAALDAWHRFVIGTLVIGGGADLESTVTANLLLVFYATGRPAPLEDLVPDLEDDELSGMRLHVEVLVQAGLLERTGPALGVSAFGRLVCRTLMQEVSGETIPVLGCYADADAATLLRAITVYEIDDIPDEVTGWVRARPLTAAVQEICTALHEVDPTARHAGLSLLAGTLGDLLGTEGRRALLALAADPELGALARARLSPDEQEQAPEPGHRASTWALVDFAMMGLESGTPAPELLRAYGYVGHPADKMSGLVTSLADSGHPLTVHLLDTLIEHHPDPEIAEAARTARTRLTSS